jgi:hypothetical protein
MSRPANKNQTLDEFVLLGHKPRTHVAPKLGVKWTECSECRGALGSQYGTNPCGDPLGSTLRRVTHEPEWFFGGRKL